MLHIILLQVYYQVATFDYYIETGDFDILRFVRAHCPYLQLKKYNK